jgi:hypothetical protein
MPRQGTLQRLQQGTHGAGGEIMDWSYYDTIVVAGATTSHSMFSVPRSAAKPLHLTNMLLGGMVPNGQRMTVHAIKFFYTGSAIRNNAGIQSIYDLINTSTIEIFIPGKDSLLTITLQELIGMSTAVALTPTVAGDNVDVNRPRYHGIYPVNSPIILAGQTTFEVRLTHWVAAAAGLNGDFIRIALNGKLERAN